MDLRKWVQIPSAPPFFKTIESERKRMKLNYRLNDYSLEESKAGLAALCFEKCPVYSTVQRLGRTCRESHPRGGRYSHVYIFSTKSLKTKKEILVTTTLTIKLKLKLSMKTFKKISMKLMKALFS